MSNDPNNKRFAVRMKMFDLFSDDLRVIRGRLNIDVPTSPEYVCPLCMAVFTKDHIYPSKGNYLTIEHVPPKAFGGNPRVLTCKQCNSHSGHLYDGTLHKFFQLRSLSTLNVSKSAKINIEFADYSFPGLLTMTGERKGSIFFDARYMPPKAFDDVKRILFNRPTETLNYGLGPGEMMFSAAFPNIKEENVYAAVLRIAYLTAFYSFGYSYVYSVEAEYVRNLIKNPNTEIINCRLDALIKDEVLGINVIYYPQELRSIVITFKLKTPSFDENVAVVLPVPGLGSNIFKALGKSKSDLSQIQIALIVGADFKINNSFIKELQARFEWEDNSK